MSAIFNMSEMTSLAFHSMALIATKGNEVVTVKAIAKEIGASENHLSKVLQRLVKAGLLRSARGPHGGFELTKPAREVRLNVIYNIMEGEPMPEGCPSMHSVCPFSGCIFGGIFNKFNREFEEYLSGHTLDDFTNFRPG